MAKKRKSPTEEDYRRIAETLKNMDIRNSIIDRDSFDYDYDIYFAEESHFKQPHIRDAIFREFRKIKPSVSNNRLFRDARGKSLSQDRQYTASEVTDDIETYKKKGANKIDLKNFDTKLSKKTGLGYINNKVVYTNQTTIRINNIEIQRLRDLKGRFARKKNK